MLLLLACSDYKVIAQQEDPAPPAADTGEVVVPAPASAISAAAGAGTCDVDGTSLTVTVTNVGEADLEVVSLATDGSGWTLARYDELPWTLAPGASNTIDLSGGTGPGTLEVVSSDPEQPSLEVPLVSEGSPPTAVFTAPTDDTVLGSEAETLTASVSDDSTAPGTPLENASFEDPVVSGMQWFEEGDIDGWIPTPGNVVEVWEDGFYGVPAWDGSQYVEINGSMAGGIYQDVATTPGASYTLDLAHRGRYGTDVARLVVDGVEIDRYSDGVSAWGTYSSTFVATGSTTRILFESVSSAACDGCGNFLDIVAVMGPCDGFDG